MGLERRGAGLERREGRERREGKGEEGEGLPDFLFQYEGSLFVYAVGWIYAQCWVDGWEVDARHDCRCSVVEVLETVKS